MAPDTSFHAVNHTYTAYRLLVSQFKQEEDNLLSRFLLLKYINPNKSTPHHRYTALELHIPYLGHDSFFYSTHSSGSKTLTAELNYAL